MLEVMKYAWLLAFVLLVPGSAYAETMEGNFVRVSPTVTIDGRVTGDVYVLAQSLTVTGDVDGDIIAAAQNIRISGNVRGSVRTASALLELDGAVGKNVTAAAASATFTSESVVAGSAYVAGSSVLFGGTVNGDLAATGQSVDIVGSVGKSVTVSTGEEGIMLVGSTSAVGNGVSVSGANPPRIASGARIAGNVTHKPLEKSGNGIAAQWFSFARLATFVGLLLLGFLWILLSPKTVQRITDRMASTPWPSIGWGVVLVVFVPVFCILLVLTIFGLPLALLGAALFVVLLFLSFVTISTFVGNWFSKNILKRPLRLPVRFLLGSVLVSFLVWMPWLGWFVGGVGTVWSFGAMVHVFRERLE